MTASKKAAELMKEINAAFGKDTMQVASDPHYVVTYLPTGIAPIDDLLQGGLPFGRFVEIFGDYSTLKSYIGYKAIAQCQSQGMIAALIDTEHSFDPEWATQCGVNVKELLIKRPENGEAAMDAAEILIRGKVDLIVFDSVAAALPKAEQEKSLAKDKVQPARLAQLMSLAMRKLTAVNSKTAVLWINQTRINVGVMFGSNEAVPGGKSLPFYASYRIAVRKSGQLTEEVQRTVIKDGKPTKTTVKRKTGQLITATLEKSKLSKPHEAIQFTFDFSTASVDEWSYIANKCLDAGVLTIDKGSWFECNNPKVKYRGRTAREALTTEYLKAILKDSESSGKTAPASKRVVSRSAASSKPVVQKSTQTQVRGASKKTVRIVRPSTKSKTR